jgi:hypothetical protein
MAEANENTPLLGAIGGARQVFFTFFKCLELDFKTKVDDKTVPSFTYH